MLKKQRFKFLIILFVITLVIVAIKGLVPKSKAEETTEIQVTYNSGKGTGKSVVTTQKIANNTNRKIVLSKNEMDFDGGTTEIDGHSYKMVLTGWQITELTQNGKKVTENLDTIYAQNGLYNVPKGVTAIEVTAIYGKAIYVRSPYDKMYYDEYHIFNNGENASAENGQVEQSSDENYGTSSDDAVASLKRAYELIEENANNTVYDNVFVLCGDLYEINYNAEGAEFAVDNEGTYKNYSSDYLGYQTGSNKPVTITSNDDKKYTLYLGAKDEEIEIYSSLRFDNINIKYLPEDNITDIHGTEITTKTYLNLADLSFFSTGFFEATENVGTEEEMNVLYGNLSSVILNSGTWNPLVARDSTIISELAKNNYLQIGGNATISKLQIGFKNSSDTDTIVNPPIVKITGGNIKELIGTKDANLMFINFEDTNEGVNYKTAGKIQKWKNVFLENSYVIIDNGLKDVENMSVPEESGLKLSNNEEITGNFNGGGELYLDSNICFTIGGDITGTTKLILTPSIVNGKNVIVGGINHPYIKVKGASTARAQSQSSDEIVSGESKYTILSQKSDYSYYYIEQDVEISNFVEIKSTNINDKIYTGSIGDNIGSSAEDISILEIGSYTQDVELNYEFYKNSTNPNKYANISRQFVLKTDKQTVTTIPSGTEILMIYNGKNYNYVVNTDTDSVNLSLFKDEDGNTFKQISNLQSADGVTKEVNGVTGDTLYNYSESFRFIVSFANIINNNASIKAGSYYSMINILDSESWIDSEQIENTNKINISQVVFKPSSINTELEKYEPNGVVTIKSAGTVQTFNGEGKQLYGNIKIYNAEGKQVDIPIGSEITLNGNTCTIVNGTTQCKFLDNCTDSGTSYNFDFKMDMKNVLEQNQLLAGNYKIKFAYAFAQNDLLNGNIAGWIDVLLTIINYSDNYGIDVSIDNSENLAEDKLQLITKGKEEFRIIHTNCSGQLEDPFVKVSVVEKTSNFDYSATENSKKITVNDNGDGSYKVTFSDSLDVGTYRVIFELFDKYGNKMSENFANFIVVDKPNI